MSSRIKNLPDHTAQHSAFCRSYWDARTPGGDSYLRSQVGGDSCATCHAYQQGRRDVATNRWSAEIDAFLLGRRDAALHAIGLIHGQIKSPTLGVKKALAILDDIANGSMSQTDAVEALDHWRAS